MKHTGKIIAFCDANHRAKLLAGHSILFGNNLTLFISSMSAKCAYQYVLYTTFQKHSTNISNTSL